MKREPQRREKPRGPSTPRTGRSDAAPNSPSEASLATVAPADLVGPPSAGTRRVVAVTGASSFLGSNLIALLEEDDSVSRIVAIDETSRTFPGPKTRSYEVDLTQPTSEARLAEILAAESAHTIVHLAFLASPSHGSAWVHELESVGTMRITVAAREAKVRKFVLWSQTMLYGAEPTNPNFLTEKHPLRASRSEPFFADKLEAEAEVQRLYQQTQLDCVVTTLRTAPIVGPSVRNVITRYLARRVVATMMGFDPLVQFLHEVDAIAALKFAVDRDIPGTFNVVGDGILPLSTVLRICGRVAVPIPHPVAERVNAALWLAQLADAPPEFLKYLRFLCVADGSKIATAGFRPAYSTREALLDFVNAQRLRDVRLIEENVG